MLLEQSFTSNLFLIQLDDEGHWYRYHHLFAELLFDQLRRSMPEQITELHQRASQIRAWIRRGKLEAIKLPGLGIIIKAGKFNEFLCRRNS